MHTQGGSNTPPKTPLPNSNPISIPTQLLQEMSHVHKYLGPAATTGSFLLGATGAKAPLHNMAGEIPQKSGTLDQFIMSNPQNPMI